MLSAVDNGVSIELLVVVVLLLLTVLLGFVLSRNSWVWAEVGFAAMFGIVFMCFPEHALKHQLSGEPTRKELFFARLYGAVFLSTGFSWFRTSHTRDATVPIALITSRVFTASILFMMQLFSFYEETLSKTKSAKKKILSADLQTNATGESQSNAVSLQWSEENFMVYFAMPTALWAVINLIHLLRSRDFNFYPQHNIRLNNHLRIDAWLMLMYGTTMISFPSHIVKVILSESLKPNCVVLHIVRATGAFCIGESITSLQAPGFLHPRDKRALLATRLIMAVLTCVVLSCGCCCLHLINVNTLMYAISLNAPVFLNAVICLASDVTAVFKVPKLAETTPVTDGIAAAVYKHDGKKFE